MSNEIRPLSEASPRQRQSPSYADWQENSGGMTVPGPDAGGEACTQSVEPFGHRSTFAMYKMEINVSGQPRIFLFRGRAAARRRSNGGATICVAPKPVKTSVASASGTPSATRPTSSLNGHRHEPPTAEEHNHSSARGLDAGHQGSRARNGCLPCCIAGGTRRSHFDPFPPPRLNGRCPLS